MSSLDTAALIDAITAEYQFYSSIIILPMGIVSNTFIIFIFTTLKIFRENHAAYYLAMESITNIGLLLVILPADIAGYLLHKNLGRASLVWCKLRSMSSYSFGLYSLYTICCLALDQYLSTNHRPNWRQKTTLQLARRLMLFNLILVLIHGILFMIFAEIGPNGCSIYQPILKVYFTYCFYPILSSIFPLLISSWFSLLAYLNVRQIIRRQIPLERRRLDQQMTAIALTRVICIIILGVPFIIFGLIQLNQIYKDDDYVKKAMIDLLAIMTHSLLYINYSINFYVFLMISSRFRHQVKYFLLKKCWHSLNNFYFRRLKLSRNNQVVPRIIEQHISSPDLSHT